jgi:UDP:flavonoid glycosyltransferase YjiC (YdhE family)
MIKYFNRKAKAVLVPYPAQGHVTPMLKLATHLVDQGLEPVLVTPDFIHRRILPQINPSDGILFMSIPDGLEEGKPRDFFAMETAMEKYMPFHLQKLVLQLQEEDGGVACLIVDLLASYAFDVANRCGVKVAGFWPAMLATYRLIAAIPDMLEAGFISETGKFISETRGFLQLVCFLPFQDVFVNIFLI